MKQIVDFANGKETFIYIYVHEAECTWHNTLAEVAC